MRPTEEPQRVDLKLTFYQEDKPFIQNGHKSYVLKRNTKLYVFVNMKSHVFAPNVQKFYDKLFFKGSKQLVWNTRYRNSVKGSNIFCKTLFTKDENFKTSDHMMHII